MRTTGFSCDLCLSHSGLLLIQFVLTGSFANGKQRYPSHWRKCRDGDAGRRSREQTSQFTRYHPTRQDQNRQNDVRHRLWWVFIRNVFCCCKSKRTEGSNFGASLLKLRLARRNDSILSLSFSEFIVDFFARLQPQDFNKRKQDETIRVMAYVIIAQKMGRDGIAKRRKTFMPAGCGQLHVCWTNVVFSFFFLFPSIKMVTIHMEDCQDGPSLCVLYYSPSVAPSSSPGAIPAVRVHKHADIRRSFCLVYTDAQ